MPTDTPVGKAYDQFGSSFDLYAHGGKGGRQGCGVIRVEEIVFVSNPDGRSVSLTAGARWASYPPSFLNTGQVSSEVAYRSGDFPISFITADYPDYGTLGLKYVVTGSYDPDGHSLRIFLENIDLEKEGSTGLFLTPVYETWTDESGQSIDCTARDDMENEFFVAAPAGEVEIPVGDSGGEGTLCQPCGQSVDFVSLEIP